MNQKCLRCNGENLEQGSLTGNRSPRICLRLDNAPIFSLFGNDLEVRCALCMDCGHLELFGDLTKARSLIK